MEMVLFFILAVMAVGTGVGVVAQRNVTKSALFLLLNFCCLAGLYILLNAQFVALIQVIVYAGAVVVLFLFVVMLLGIDRIVEVPDSRRYQWIAAVLLGALLLAGVVWAVVETGTGAMPELVRSDNVREIGAALLTDYMIPFELVSLVLLVAVIGALVLAKKRLER
jgi:NADH-quinone oxidoreductase subunit J